MLSFFFFLLIEKFHIHKQAWVGVKLSKGSCPPSSHTLVHANHRLRLETFSSYHLPAHADCHLAVIAFLNLEIYYMPYTASHLSLALWTFNDSLRLPRTPKLSHALGGFHKRASSYLSGFLSLGIHVSWNPHSSHISPLLVPGHALALWLHTFVHTVLCICHTLPLCLSLKSHLSVKAMLKSHLPYEVLSDLSRQNYSVLWYFHSSSLVLSLYSLAAYIFLSFSKCFQFLKIEIRSYLGIYPLHCLAPCLHIVLTKYLQNGWK